jgi:hypothetical protein
LVQKKQLFEGQRGSKLPHSKEAQCRQAAQMHKLQGRVWRPVLTWIAESFFSLACIVLLMCSGGIHESRNSIFAAAVDRGI